MASTELLTRVTPTQKVQYLAVLFQKNTLNTITHFQSFESKNVSMKNEVPWRV